MLTMRFSLSRHCDTRGRGFSLGRIPYVRDFICQCSLPNASPKQKHSREACIKIKKAASLNSCAAPAIWVMEGCKRLSPFSLLRNIMQKKCKALSWNQKIQRKLSIPQTCQAVLVNHILILIYIYLCSIATIEFKCFFFIVACT